MDGLGGPSPNREPTSVSDVQEPQVPEEKNLLDTVKDFLERFFSNLFTERKNNEDTDLKLPAQPGQIGGTESISRDSKIEKLGETIRRLETLVQGKGNYGERLDYYDSVLESLDDKTLDKMSATLSGLEMKLGHGDGLEIKVEEPHSRRLHLPDQDEAVMHELDQLNRIVEHGQGREIIRKL